MTGFIDNLKQRLRIWLSVPENDITFMIGTTSLTNLDRNWSSYSRDEILEQCQDVRN